MDIRTGTCGGQERVSVPWVRVGGSFEALAVAAGN